MLCLQLLAHFGTSPTEGLTSDQVARARAQYGVNELPTEPPPSIFKLILQQFDDLLVKILLAAAVVDLVRASTSRPTPARESSMTMHWLHNKFN